MVQRSQHYDFAFEEYLRRRRVPYVGVDEARRALLPERSTLKVTRTFPDGSQQVETLKSFDFVVYDDSVNRLVAVKGRKVSIPSAGITRPGRLETWVNRDDIDSLLIWQRLFGEGFQACIVFLYWCHAQPPDGLFNEVFAHNGRWYAMRSVTADDYAKHMKERSRRWNTVDLPSAAFKNISEPFKPGRASAPRSIFSRLSSVAE
jgi:hypothetical protein